MKKLLSVLLLLTVTLISFSQQPVGKSKSKKPVANPAMSKADLQKVKLIEDSLHLLCVQFTTDTSIQARIKACYAFIPKLVSALKLNNSFYYHFDSLETVSTVYPPDSSFRILTWQLVLPKGQFRYYGVMQLKSSKMKIYPLHDLSDTMQYHTQQQTTNDNWYGALYYNVIQQQVGLPAGQAGKQNIYTLFGFEAADYITRRKVVEILTFSQTGKPQFGAPLFHFKYDSTHIKLLDTMSRFFIEYKYKAPTVLNYDRQMQMIVFDHVAPQNEKAKGATFTYVPDGTYEGFLWTKDHWQWVEKVFTFSIDENDNPPIPQPLFGQPGRQPEMPK